MTSLPDGLTQRPLVPADAAAVFETMAEEQLHDLGTVEIELADIVGDWQRPSFDITSRTVGVFDGERLVGYAEVSGRDRGEAAVRPAQRGRGIGTWLASWMQDCARTHGADVVGMPVPQGSPGDRLLESLGYHVRWTSWVLQLPAGTAIADRELPAGYTVGAASPDQYVAAHDVLEDAFLEWSERDREPYGDFEAGVLHRPGFAPWQLRVVTDEAGAVAAVAVVMLVPEGVGGQPEAYIDRLATRRDQRGRGLAQALMVDSFARAREHGAATSSLSTDSRTGALGLYERVGMQVTSVWVNRAISL
ncbi:GNAT family N-acetyltransferase [Nocardioides sp. GXZ039]|uniref:GNAT family N-acetyltransferase n=1 Tax=Nocardioides sp. GXZ039 TaxID=3136018 RepID=UPI0030F3CB18